MTGKPSWGARLTLRLLRGYQLVFSSLMGRSCRYYPTCSSYTAEAVRRFGALRGLAMGFARIGRCHPFHPGGYDPVPEGFSIRGLFGVKKPCGHGAGCDKHAPSRK